MIKKREEEGRRKERKRKKSSSNSYPHCHHYYQAGWHTLVIPPLPPVRVAHTLIPPLLPGRVARTCNLTIWERKTDECLRLTGQLG